VRDKSEENWNAGYACLDAEHYNAAASRFYYAVFQAVLFYARKKQQYKHQPNKIHSDMMSYVERQNNPRWLRVFSQLKGLRVTADYDPDRLQKNDIQKILNEADDIRKSFLKEAEL
jgi:HEPN domain.